MAIDETPIIKEKTTEPKAGWGGGTIFVVIFLALAALAAGESYSVTRMNTVRDQLITQQNQLRDDFTGQLRDQVTRRLSAIQEENAEQLDAVKTELDAAAKRVGAQGLDRASSVRPRSPPRCSPTAAGMVISRSIGTAAM